MNKQLAITVINLPHRTDRRIETEAVLTEASFAPGDYRFFAAKRMPNCGFRGCSMSHAMALSEFLFNDEREHILMLEDDIHIVHPPSFQYNLQLILDQSPHFDVCLFAHNQAITMRPTVIGGIFHVAGAQTMSAYLVSRRVAPALIECFFRSSELIRSEIDPKVDNNFSATKRVFSCDVMWKDLQTRMRFWATTPALCQQRPSFSDIELRPSDYGA